MSRLRILLAALVAAAHVLVPTSARAQDEDAPVSIEPPPTPATPTPTPTPEDEASSLDPSPPAPTPTPAPLSLPEEPRAPRFGSAGVTVITGSSVIGASHTAYDESDASSTTVSFSPGIDYFVAQHVSLGLDLSAFYQESRSYGTDGSLIATTTTTIGLGARVGVDIPLGSTVSWYPRFTFGIAKDEQHRETDSQSVAVAPFSASPSGGSSSRTGPWVVLFAPVLVHPRPHFFFGAGPSVSHDFAEAKGPGFFLGERTSFAGRIVLGAWWGGTPDAPPPVEASARNAVKAPRFGEPQQVLFTSEAGASLSHSSYSEEATTVTSFSLTPGIDYFVASQVSLGLAAHVGYANEKNGHATTVESTAFAVTPRIGFNVPIAEWVSLYLRGFLQAGVRTYNDELSSVTRNFVAIGIYTPLLLHVASHAFAGFGPYVSHELVNKVPGGSGVQNLATSFGANLIVGAWL